MRDRKGRGKLGGGGAGGTRGTGEASERNKCICVGKALNSPANSFSRRTNAVHVITSEEVGHAGVKSSSIPSALTGEGNETRTNAVRLRSLCPW